ncbi:MAG: hypothetical protein LBH54_00705 [Clostridiales bacterium]|jgi:uncharacterized FAD-dependent dehydrogenase|nr:hypothetical protein [Clostridiales bacterium]
MKIKVDNVFAPLSHSVDEVYRDAMRLCGITARDVAEQGIYRRSVDARRDTVRFNYCVFFVLHGGAKPNNRAVVLAEEPPEDTAVEKELPYRPIIIGAGPSGLFAGYYLALRGCRPILFERGGNIEKRVRATSAFFSGGALDTECNIQFGEGGAGTFSDGKLTTRVNDKLCGKVLDIFIRHGAPGDIRYLAKPHIGTDLLRGVIENMRNSITALGGEIHFDSRLEGLKIKNGRLYSATVNGAEHDCPALLLAIGHSARDTYQMLFDSGVPMAAKPFAVGLRIEHLQADIDAAQYGKFAGHPALGAADYRLAYNGAERKCFSFCMCPGGSVVAAASEERGVAVNGMSGHARNGTNANSALVVNVTERDFHGVLGGIAFQRRYERAAYRLAERYLAPAQLTRDFLENKKSTRLGGVTPTYPLGYRFAELHGCLPEFVATALCDGIRYFDRKINGFSARSVLTGVETRTSAPVRIPRGETMESVNVKGLYPVGEGAGYAGGIMSSAVDGVKAAQALLCRR